MQALKPKHRTILCQSRNEQYQDKKRSLMFQAVKKMALALDEKGELFKILDAHESREENDKHGL